MKKKPEKAVEKHTPDTPTVPKEKYDALLSAFNQVLERSNLDVIQKSNYKKIAGL